MLPSAWMRKTRASRSPEPGPFTGSGRNHSTTRWSVFADDDLSRPPSKRSSRHRRNQLVKLGLVALLFISAFWLFRRSLTRKKPLRPPSEPTPFTPPPPLAGCFDPKRVAATQYNLARHEQGWKRHNLNAGTNIKFEMECYDFAGTIRPDEHDPPRTTSLIFHTYWRSDLSPFSARQASTLDSFFATQHLDQSQLILWTNNRADLITNPLVQTFLDEWPGIFSVKQVDIQEMLRGTVLYGGTTLTPSIYDETAWVDGDAVRLLALWNHGGLWFDMDEILLRDMSVLAEQEFMTQWDCRGM